MKATLTGMTIPLSKINFSLSGMLVSASDNSGARPELIVQRI